MRLINTRTLELIDFSLKNIPQYAILSHTWEEDEITYHEMVNPQPNTSRKHGFLKIEQTCDLAASESFKYVWIDTCCIDKTSSAELSEAINSMYAWYQRAEKCYVYLSDLTPDARIPNDISRCRWLTRGWTLQELLAPNQVDFYDSRWKHVGSKLTLAEPLARYTKIDLEAITDRFVPEAYSVATKMSWAARRETTRIEDTAYCLLGIFNVNMPLLYGEEEKSFMRLQEAIIKDTRDPTIFAWQDDIRDNVSDPQARVLAPRPASFRIMSGIFMAQDVMMSTDFSLTNRGIYFSGDINLRVIKIADPGTDIEVIHYLLVLSYTGREADDHIGIRLRKFGPKLYYREKRPPLVDLHRLPMKQISICRAKQFWIAAGPKRVLDHNLRNLRQGAIHVSAQPGWVLEQVSPTDHWDWRSRVFFRRKRGPGFDKRFETIFALAFKGSFEGQEVCIVLCISNGWHGRYATHIKVRDRTAIIDALLFSSAYTAEGIDTLQLLDRDPKLLKESSNRLLFQAGKSQYEVSASFANRELVDSIGTDMVLDLELRTSVVDRPRSRQ